MVVIRRHPLKLVVLGAGLVACATFGGGVALGAATHPAKPPTSALACISAKGVLSLTSKGTCSKAGGLRLVLLPLSTVRGAIGPQGPMGATGATGASGATGAAGPSASTVVEIAKSTIPMLTPSSTTLATVNLAVGASYLLSATVMMVNALNPSTNVAELCAIDTTGSVSVFGLTTPELSLSYLQYGELSASASISIPAGTTSTVTFGCSSGSTLQQVRGGLVTATQVGSVVASAQT